MKGFLYMIGQNKLKENVEQLINNNTFPHTYIITGQQGSGRSTAAEYISKKLNAINYMIDNKVDNIRQLIEDANTVQVKIQYTIKDIDYASVNAQNALLKLIEETPDNAYFCLTAQSEQTVLPTIKSRSVIFTLQPYSTNELQEFCKQNNMNIKLDICDTMQDILLLKDYNYSEFECYIDKLYTMFSKLGYSSIFKVGNDVKLKDKGKYDIHLFFKLFIKKSLKERNIRYVKITNKYLDELKINGNNKQMLFDNWLLEMRGGG